MIKEALNLSNKWYFANIYFQDGKSLNIAVEAKTIFGAESNIKKVIKLPIKQINFGVSKSGEKWFEKDEVLKKANSFIPLSKNKVLTKDEFMSINEYRLDDGRTSLDLLNDLLKKVKKYQDMVHDSSSSMNRTFLHNHILDLLKQVDVKKLSGGEKPLYEKIIKMFNQKYIRYNGGWKKVDENSTSGAIAGFSTPYAFSTKKRVKVNGKKKSKGYYPYKEIQDSNIPNAKENLTLSENKMKLTKLLKDIINESTTYFVMKVEKKDGKLVNVSVVTDYEDHGGGVSAGAKDQAMGHAESLNDQEHYKDHKEGQPTISYRVITANNSSEAINKIKQSSQK